MPNLKFEFWSDSSCFYYRLKSYWKIKIIGYYQSNFQENFYSWLVEEEKKFLVQTTRNHAQILAITTERDKQKLMQYRHDFQGS